MGWVLEIQNTIFRFRTHYSSGKFGDKRKHYLLERTLSHEGHFRPFSGKSVSIDSLRLEIFRRDTVRNFVYHNSSTAERKPVWKGGG